MCSQNLVRLGDYTDLLTGNPFKSSQYSTDRAGIRLLRGDNVVQGKIRWDGVKRWPLARATDFRQYELVPGDVVVAMDRPWIEAGLKYAIVRQRDAPSLLVQRVARLRARPGLDQGYLGYVIGSRDFAVHVLAVQTGTAIPHISPSQLQEFSFHLPPLAEQRSIAFVLGAFDDKIEINLRQIQIQEELATRIIDQVGAHIPLLELATTQRSTIDPALSGATLVDHFSLPAFDEGRLPIRQPGEEIKSGKLRIDGVSILVSRLNPHIPRVWYAVPENGVLGVASTEFVVMTPTHGVSAEELWACCNSARFTSSLVENVTGTTGSHQRVKATDVLATGVGDPRSLSSGQKQAVSAMVKSVHLLRKESVALSILRNALLPQLLSEELTLSGAEGLVGESV
jgi:hypothetical protein